MGKTKKFLSLFLSMVLVFAISAIPAMAENTGTIVGVETIIAPPAGTMTVLPIKILDAEGNVLADPTLTITNSNVKGIYKSGSNILVDGDEITAGTFTLTATSGDVTASKEVTVSGVIWHEDFEDVTGESGYANNSLLPNMDGSQSTLSIAANADAPVLTEGGKKYADDSATITIPVAQLSNVPTVITIDAKARKTAYAMMKFANRYNDCSVMIQRRTYTDWQSIDVFDHATNKYVIEKWSSSAGTLASNPSGTDWVNVRVEADFVNGKISYYENGRLWMSADVSQIKMQNLSNIIWQSELDEIHIYTGVNSSSSNLGSISGADKIAAPAAEECSKYDGYQVLDSEGNVIDDAIITYSGNIPGVKFENGALFVNGSTVRAGSFILRATKADGELVAKKQVEILPDRYSEDFDDVTVGESAVSVTETKLVKLDGSASDKSIASSGNVTVNGSTNSADDNTMALETTPFNNANILTVRFKAQRAASPQYYLTFKTDDNVQLSIKYYSNGYLWIENDRNKSEWYDLGGGPSADTLSDVTIIFDFVEHSFTYENTTIKPTSLANSKSLVSFSIFGNKYVDDVSYFTGKNVSLTAESGRLTIPAEGEASCAVSATYSDGTPTTITSITENYDGITTEGGAIKVSSTALVQPYTFTVSDGFMSADVTFQADKDVVLLNGAAFNNEDLVAGSSNTVSAVLAASDLEAGKRVIIAHYGKDANGNACLKDVKLSEISTASVKEVAASLTANADEGDVIKVFKWNWNALAPINSVVID